MKEKTKKYKVQGGEEGDVRIKIFKKSKWREEKERERKKIKLNRTWKGKMYLFKIIWTRERKRIRCGGREK